MGARDSWFDLRLWQMHVAGVVEGEKGLSRALGTFFRWQGRRVLVAVDETGGDAGKHRRYDGCSPPRTRFPRRQVSGPAPSLAGATAVQSELC
jgi:hypothetical protein